MKGKCPRSTSLRKQRVETVLGCVSAFASILVRSPVRGRTLAIGPGGFAFCGSRLGVLVFVAFGTRIGRTARVQTFYDTSRSPRALTGVQESCEVFVWGDLVPLAP